MAAELSTSQMVAIDELVRNFQEEQIEVLTRNAAAAHVVGDVQAHKALGLNIKQYMDLINEEAAKYAKSYAKDLAKGGTYIQGKWVPWLADRTKEDREKIASIIQQGYLQGKATGKTQYQKAGKYGLYPKNTIAGDLQEYFNQRRSHAATVARTEIARIQVAGSLNRYKKQSVKKVLWLTFEPCEICDQFNRRVYKINDLPREIPVHPHCKCAVAPVADEVPTGPAPEQQVPEGFEEPLPYKAPSKPQTITHDEATVTYKDQNVGWQTAYQRNTAGEISRDEYAAIRSYTGSDYEEFNWWLRDGDKAIEQMALDWAETTGGDINEIRKNITKRAMTQWPDQMDRLDAVIARSKLPADTVLYRSCGPETAAALLRDGEYLYKNYSSTSVNFRSCMGFGSNSADGYRDVLVMKHKKGSRGLYINDSENEVILPRNTNYRLVQVRKVENVHAYDPSLDRDYPHIRFLIVETEP
jgi:SPP1 gp7 family putative phage head morphogenesis protein